MLHMDTPASSPQVGFIQSLSYIYVCRQGCRQKFQKVVSPYLCIEHTVMMFMPISFAPRPPPRFYLAATKKNLGGGLEMRLHAYCTSTAQSERLRCCTCSTKCYHSVSSNRKVRSTYCNKNIWPEKTVSVCVWASVQIPSS